jgi:hypothetical protein
MTKAELKILKAATKKLTKWESSGKAFGHFNVIEAKATDSQLANNKGADRIYEFYCLMRILSDLKTNYKIILVPGKPANKIFPQSPALKRGWPYFIIENLKDKNNRFQVCYGTKIRMKPTSKTTFALDISIQKHDSTDDPDRSMVDLIMDAKFKYSTNSSLPVEQLHSFMQRVSALGTNKASSIQLSLNTLSNLKGNCLLTNGNALEDHEDYCRDYYIKQVEQFDINKAYNVVG